MFFQLALSVKAESGEASSCGSVGPLEGEFLQELKYTAAAVLWAFVWEAASLH